MAGGFFGFSGIEDEDPNVVFNTRFESKRNPLCSEDADTTLDESCRWMIRSGYSYTPSSRETEVSDEDSTIDDDECCEESVDAKEDKLDNATDHSQHGCMDEVTQDAFEEQELECDGSCTTEHFTSSHPMDKLLEPDDVKIVAVVNVIDQLPEPNDGTIGISTWSHQLPEDVVERMWWGKLLRKSSKPSLQTVYEIQNA